MYAKITDYVAGGSRPNPNHVSGIGMTHIMA